MSRILSHLNPFTKEEASHEGLTSLSGLWSELVLRDIAATIHSLDRVDDRCCTTDGNRHPECYEIRDESLGCTSYWRSVPSLTVYGCQFVTREQMNGASAYLDGSGVYGVTDDKLHLLRTYEDGKVDLTICELCNRTESYVLGSLQQILLREHNRVAEKLAATNAHWDDTKLFLEARRIVVAQLQHITLNEYVTAVLGEGALVDPELRPTMNGFRVGYSSSNQGGTYDAVALAALRALTWTHADGSNMRAEEHAIASASRVNLAAMPDAAIRFVHMARDHGIPGYAEFLADCLNGGAKVSWTEINSMTHHRDTSNSMTEVNFRLFSILSYRSYDYT